MFRRSIVAVGVLVLVTTAGCRSSFEGSASRDIASVAEDVARRTGAEPPLPESEELLASTRREILSRPLTEEAAVKLALLGNASVRASYERLGIARADLLQAGLISNPVFSASLKSFSAGPEVELGLAQSFVDIFFLPLRRRVAVEELAAAQAVVAKDLVRLVYDVRRGFVRIRGAQDVTKIRREGLAAVLSARDLMKKLHEAGNVRDADLTVEEVGATRAQIGVDLAELLGREAREELNVLLGLGSADPGWRLEGSLPALPPSTITAAVEDRALGASLDLLEECARVRAAMVSAGLAQRQGGLSHFDLGAVGKREASDGAWGFGPEISTAIPIFDTGAAKVLAASARTREHLARHAQLSVEIGAAARRLLDRVTTLRARERAMRETYLPLRSRLVNETTQAFNAMQIGAFDVLDAKEAESDARREHAETLTSAWLARLDLGELLAGSLNRQRLETFAVPEPAEHPTPPKGH